MVGLTLPQSDAVRYVASKYGASDAIMDPQRNITFYIADGTTHTRHLLSVTNEYRREKGLNELAQIDIAKDVLGISHNEPDQTNEDLVSREAVDNLIGSDENDQSPDPRQPYDIAARARNEIRDSLRRGLEDL